MLRAALWTVGLFSIGLLVTHFFSGPLIEPLVLLALGASLFLVSGRAPAAKVNAVEEQREAAQVPTPRPERA